MDVNAHHSIEELEQCARAEKHAGRHLMLRAVILAKRVWVAVQIAEALGKSRRTIQKWVSDYNRDSLEGLLAPSINTGVVNRFLQEMSKEIDKDVQVVLIWDGAGYHTSGQLKVPGNITPIKLPPYSPELNPIENLWHYLRSHHWSNRKYADYDALREAGCDAWQKTCLKPDIIQSVCKVDYIP